MGRALSWIAIASILLATGAWAEDEPAADEETPRVVLYMTSWCHYCRLTSEFLTRKGVAFAEKDIESDTQALGEYMAAGGNGGVPMVIIGDTRIMGYDVAGMERALAALPGSTPPPDPPPEEAPPPAEPKKPAGKWPKAVQGAAIDIVGDVPEPDVHYVITREDVLEAPTLDLDHHPIDTVLDRSELDEDDD